MIKGIIFDMDGVIVDSEPLYHEFEYKFFRNLGAEFDADYLLKYVGSSINKTIEGICSDFNITSIPKENIYKIFSDGVRLIYSSNPKLKLCEGVIEWLEFFKKSNYSIALASSTYAQKVEICLERFNLTQYFDFCTCGDQVENSKPHPEIFIKSCEKLGLLPNECVVIEDSQAGISAAKAAGCLCIGYLNKGRNCQNITQSDIVFDTFGEGKLHMLENFLKQDNASNSCTC